MIELDDVFVLYPCLDRQVAALRGLTLTVAPSERVVITGPSGSGKSTLVRLITGQVRPSAGRATVLDHDLAIASPKAILALQRSGVGVITQQMTANLAVELSVLHNVALQSRLAGVSNESAQQLASAMLDRLALAHLAHRPLRTISAGESQRVAIAAALAHRPRVIVADEPTGALDLNNANIVFDLLAELSAELGAALLVVSHDPGAARIGQRVLDIRDGRLGSEALSNSDATRLVVDERGWVRLPEIERVRAGISTRAVIDFTAHSDPSRDTRIVLHAPTQSPPAVEMPFVSTNADPADRSLILSDIVTVAHAGFSIGKTTILAPTSLTVRRGELMIVAGRSGSGKTTLLSLIAGFRAPSTGSIERRPGERIAVAATSLGFAETMSVRHNVELACAVRGQRSSEALDARITGLLHDLDIGDLADRPINSLSGGERQRASIARALASEATLVVLDEPTSQLDQGFAHLVARLLREQARSGRAILCASHEPELIAMADHVHTLEQ